LRFSHIFGAELAVVVEDEEEDEVVVVAAAPAGLGGCVDAAKLGEDVLERFVGVRGTELRPPPLHALW
jgi:hypothetical protein